MTLMLAGLLTLATDTADILPRIAAMTPEQTEVVCMMAAGRSPSDFYVVMKHGDAAARESIIARLPGPGRPIVQAGIDTTKAASPERLAAARAVVAGLMEHDLVFENLLELLSMRGRHREAAESLEVGFKSRADFRDANYYSWATYEWALAGDKEAAFRNLELAVDDSLSDLGLLGSDTAFRFMQQDPRWEELAARVNALAALKTAALPDSHVPLATVSLPVPKVKGKVSVEETMQKRRSVRSYTDQPLTLAEVSQLCWAAYGVTQKIPNAPSRLRGGLKTAPSAGGRYPLELYVIAGNVTGLEPGVYNYRPEAHELWLVADGDRREMIDNGQGMMTSAPAVFVYSAVFERTTSKYGDRGRQRYVCMDLGHSAENLCLQAVALGLGTCPVGAFSDMDLKTAVGMTRAEEPLYILPVGHPGQ